MSPIRDSARPSTHARPPARRGSNNPKSTRQQFSACGACRMRRVKCDLKDLQARGSPATSCSNCQERGLKCVDEFAEIKQVKLLRQGRRLKEVHQVYGRTTNSGMPGPAGSSEQPSIIPKLMPEFFHSAFFRKFQIQRPILEPTEFMSRFFEYAKGNEDALGIPGQLITMILVIWAASFGVNEYGVEEPHDGVAGLRRNKDRTTEMLREFLHLIDLHGLLRKPSWDGVRVLLLTLPLSDELPQHPLDRLAMHEATIGQVYTLCSLAPISSINSGEGEYIDALVRARIFWYAHVIEGVTIGLRGGRLLLSEDDLVSFQSTLPHMSGRCPTPSSSSVAYQFTSRYMAVPIRLGTACRQVHAVLTGPKARQADEIDEDKLLAIWDTLETLWDDFEGLRTMGTSGMIQSEEVDKYVHGWQIFIFECYNIIREALKQRIVAISGSETSFVSEASAALRELRHEKATRLHCIADTKCHEVATHVVVIMRQFLGTSFFQYDASLVRDGCFFAGFLLATDLGTEEDLHICLTALGEMRWAFAKSEERETTLRMVWDARMTAERQKVNIANRLSPSESDPRSRATYSAQPSVRHLPTPLCLAPSSIVVEPGPNTAATDESNWTNSTASSSGGHSCRGDSLGSRHHSPASSSGSSSLPHLDSASFPSKGQTTDPQSTYYHLPEIEQFPFASHTSGHQHSGAVTSATTTTSYHHGTYFHGDPVVYSAAASAVSAQASGVPMANEDEDCPQFGREYFYP